MAVTLVVLLGVSVTALLRFDSSRRAARRSSDSRRAADEVIDLAPDEPRDPAAATRTEVPA